MPYPYQQYLMTTKHKGTAAAIIHALTALEAVNDDESHAFICGQAFYARNQLHRALELLDEHGPVAIDHWLLTGANR